MVAVAGAPNVDLARLSDNIEDVYKAAPSVPSFKAEISAIKSRMLKDQQRSENAFKTFNSHLAKGAALVNLIKRKKVEPAETAPEAEATTTEAATTEAAPTEGATNEAAAAEAAAAAAAAAEAKAAEQQATINAQHQAMTGLKAEIEQIRTAQAENTASVESHKKTVEQLKEMMEQAKSDLTSSINKTADALKQSKDENDLKLQELMAATKTLEEQYNEMQALALEASTGARDALDKVAPAQHKAAEMEKQFNAIDAALKAASDKMAAVKQATDQAVEQAQAAEKSAVTAQQVDAQPTFLMQQASPAQIQHDLEALRAMAPKVTPPTALKVDHEQKKEIKAPKKKKEETKKKKKEEKEKPQAPQKKKEKISLQPLPAVAQGKAVKRPHVAHLAVKRDTHNTDDHRKKELERRQLPAEVPRRKEKTKAVVEDKVVLKEKTPAEHKKPVVSEHVVPHEAKPDVPHQPAPEKRKPQEATHATPQDVSHASLPEPAAREPEHKAEKDATKSMTGGAVPTMETRHSISLANFFARDRRPISKGVSAETWWTALKRWWHPPPPPALIRVTQTSPKQNSDKTSRAVAHEAQHAIDIGDAFTHLVSQDDRVIDQQDAADRAEAWHSADDLGDDVPDLAGEGHSIHVHDAFAKLEKLDEAVSQDLLKPDISPREYQELRDVQDKSMESLEKQLTVA